MKNKIYSLIISLVFCFNLQAVGFFNFEKAEEAYTAGEYETALQIYNSALDMGYESADLYYNLANCYYRKAELAASILNYERALKLDPSHEDAKHNLAFAESKTVDNINVIGNIFLVDWWNAICNIASADAWAIISIVLFVSAGRITSSKSIIS
jgi:tetratricopeptide (TPR) repeat protein